MLKGLQEHYISKSRQSQETLNWLGILSSKDNQRISNFMQASSQHILKFILSFKKWTPHTERYWKASLTASCWLQFLKKKNGREWQLRACPVQHNSYRITPRNQESIMTIFQNAMGQHEANPCSWDWETTTEQQVFITHYFPYFLDVKQTKLVQAYHSKSRKHQKLLLLLPNFGYYRSLLAYQVLS